MARSRPPQRCTSSPSRDLSEQIRRLENQLGVTLFTRTNRKLILTDAAQVLIPHAQRTLRAAANATASVDPIRSLSGGSVAFGTFSSAHHLLSTELVTRFRALHPLVRLRIVGLNSVHVADQVREGQLEAGLVALPVEDRGLTVSNVVWAAEAVYLSRDHTRTAAPKTLHELADAPLVLPEVRWGDADPTRRQLLSRAQNLGISIEPMVEVESPAAALDIAGQGRPRHHHLPATGTRPRQVRAALLGLPGPTVAGDLRLHHPPRRRLDPCDLRAPSPRSHHPG